MDTEQIQQAVPESNIQQEQQSFEQANVEELQPKPQNDVSTTLNINDITEANGFNPNEMMDYMKSRGMDYSGEDAVDMARALTKQQYEYYAKERKNFGPDADALMEKLKQGHKLTDDEGFLLMNEQEWIDSHSEILAQKKELMEIKEKVANGKISQQDFSRLADICGFNSEMKDLLAQEFSAQGKLIDDYEENIDDMGKTM